MKTRRFAAGRSYGRFIMRIAFVSITMALLGTPLAVHAEDKDVLTLKLIAKQDTYVLDRGGKTADEYKKMLDELADPKAKGMLPKPPIVDFVLEVKNTSKQPVSIYVGGDPNVYVFDLKGPAVFSVNPRLAMTLEFRIPMEKKLDAGQTYEIPVKLLADGARGVSRWLYWMEYGAYTIGAAYQLSDKDGGKGQVLKAEPVKITIVQPKKE